MRADGLEPLKGAFEMFDGPQKGQSPLRVCARHGEWLRDARGRVGHDALGE